MPAGPSYDSVFALDPHPILQAWSLVSLALTQRAPSNGELIVLANWVGVLVSICFVVGPIFRRIGFPSVVNVLLR